MQQSQCLRRTCINLTGKWASISPLLPRSKMISYGINSFFGEIDYFYLFIPEIEPVEIGTHFVNRKYFQPSLLVIESFHKARKNHRLRPYSQWVKICCRYSVFLESSVERNWLWNKYHCSSSIRSSFQLNRHLKTNDELIKAHNI